MTCRWHHWFAMCELFFCFLLLLAFWTKKPPCALYLTYHIFSTRQCLWATISFIVISMCCPGELSLRPFVCHLWVFFLFFLPFRVLDQKDTLCSISHLQFIFNTPVPMGNDRFYCYLNVLTWKVVAATIRLPFVSCFLVFSSFSRFGPKRHLVFHISPTVYF